MKRQPHHSDKFTAWVRAGLSFGALGLFGYVLMIVIAGPGKGEGAVASVLLGGLGGILTQVFSYYFGQSAREATNTPTGEEGDPISTEVTNASTSPVQTEVVDPKSEPALEDDTKIEDE